jgi:hypothetical protein
MTRYSPRTGLPQTYQVGPFDSSHIYVQWGGKLPGNEQWSCGFRMWKAAGSTEADANALLPGVSAAIAAYHVSTSSQISAAAKLSFVKVNAIGTDGRYIGAGTVEATYADTPGGGAAIPPHPNQVALVISLMTGFSRGPAHRGRFYMPLPVFLPAADGLIADSDRDFARTAAQGLRTAVNTNSSGHVMAVMSRKAGAPGHRSVTGIEVGRALDTQRRRRRSLVEDYQ